MFETLATLIPGPYSCKRLSIGLHKTSGTECRINELDHLVKKIEVVEPVNYSCLDLVAKTEIPVR
jgi:hypothetical protein